MAVDPIRDRIRIIIHIVLAQEPGASSLPALVCSVGKIPDSLVITSRYWEPSTVATRLGGNACRAVRRDGAGQPTLHTVDDAGDLSTDSVDSFPEYGSSASHVGAHQELPSSAWMKCPPHGTRFRNQFASSRKKRPELSQRIAARTKRNEVQ